MWVGVSSVAVFFFNTVHLKQHVYCSFQGFGFFVIFIISPKNKPRTRNPTPSLWKFQFFKFFASFTAAKPRRFSFAPPPRTTTTSGRFPSFSSNFTLNESLVNLTVMEFSHFERDSTGLESETPTWPTRKNVATVSFLKEGCVLWLIFKLSFLWFQLLLISCPTSFMLVCW